MHPLKFVMNLKNDCKVCQKGIILTGGPFFFTCQYPSQQIVQRCLVKAGGVGGGGGGLELHHVTSVTCQQLARPYFIKYTNGYAMVWVCWYLSPAALDFVS